MSAVRQSSPRSSGFSIQIDSLAGSADAWMRKDPFTRLLLMHSGKGVLVQGPSEQELTATSVVVIPPGLPHALHGDADLKWTLVRFDAAKLRMETWHIAKSAEFRRVFAISGKRARAAAAVFGMLPRRFEQAAALSGEIAREISERRPGWQDLATVHFQHLVILLSRYAGSGLRISADASQRVAAAVRHIDAHFSEDIDSASLASGCGMSERSFYRLFLQATGETPLRYLKRVRIDRAAELLRLTDRTVTEIAFEVGFEDSNFFAREFRKLRDHPPTVYRKIWQE